MLVADDQLPFLFLPKPHTPGFMFSVPRMSPYFAAVPSGLPISKRHQDLGRQREKNNTKQPDKPPLWENKQRKPEGSPHRKGPTNSWAPSVQQPGPPRTNPCPCGVYVPAGWGRGGT